MSIIELVRTKEDSGTVSMGVELDSNTLLDVNIGDVTSTDENVVSVKMILLLAVGVNNVVTERGLDDTVVSVGSGDWIDIVSTDCVVKKEKLVNVWTVVVCG